MTEEKKQQTAKMLARECHLDADYGGVCPVGDGDDCPFPEKLCTEVAAKDWLEWMDEDNGNN